MNRLFLLELNEFNADVLREGARVFGLRDLQWVLDFPETRTTTDDTYESDRLEPWVQWVCVHTGKRSLEHGIRHLGDVPDLAFPQIWEKLSAQGITSGVWGILNGQKGNAEKCSFFVPDPWTFSEVESPAELRGLIDLPRYVTKNRSNFSAGKALALAAKLALKCRPRTVLAMLRELPAMIAALMAFRGQLSVFFLFFEYFSSLFFLDAVRRYRPQLAVLFVNSLAHVQHYYWNVPVPQNRRLRWTLYFVDRVIRNFRRQFGDDYQLAMMNALSQSSTAEEPTWILYRVTDLAQFLKLQAIPAARFEALMSYDATLFFDSADDLLRAMEILNSCSIHGRPLFYLEPTESELRLFFRMAFSDEAPPEARYQCGGREFRFFDHFAKIVQRTAKHSPIGSVFAPPGIFPDEIENFQVESYVTDYLAVHDVIESTK